MRVLGCEHLPARFGRNYFRRDLAVSPRPQEHDGRRDVGGDEPPIRNPWKPDGSRGRKTNGGLDDLGGFWATVDMLANPQSLEVFSGIY